MFTTISRKCQLFSYNFPFFLSNYCDITIQFIYISNQIHRFEKCNKSKEAIFRGTPGFLRILRFLLNVTHPRRNSRNSSKDLTFLQISAVSVLRSPSFSFSSCFQFVSLFFFLFPYSTLPLLPHFGGPWNAKKVGPTRGPLRVVVVVLQHSTSETSAVHTCSTFTPTLARFCISCFFWAWRETIDFRWRIFFTRRYFHPRLGFFFLSLLSFFLFFRLILYLFPPFFFLHVVMCVCVR